MRFGNQRFGVLKIRHGNSMMIGRVVIPMIVGVMNGANRFSFIFFLREVGLLCGVLFRLVV